MTQIFEQEVAETKTVICIATHIQHGAKVITHKYWCEKRGLWMLWVVFYFSIFKAVCRYQSWFQSKMAHSGRFLWFYCSFFDIRGRESLYMYLSQRVLTPCLSRGCLLPQQMVCCTLIHIEERTLIHKVWFHCSTIFPKPLFT